MEQLHGSVNTLLANSPAGHRRRVNGRMMVALAAAAGVGVTAMSLPAPARAGAPASTVTAASDRGILDQQTQDSQAQDGQTQDGQTQDGQVQDGWVPDSGGQDTWGQDDWGQDGSGQDGSGSDPWNQDGSAVPQTPSRRGTGSGQARASASLSTGVVLIDTQSASGQGAGTGMVLTSDGQVLTSYHVVNGSTSVQVTVASTGRQYEATVVGHDAAKDVALLKLQGASGLSPVKLDRDAVNEGTAITAVGNAGGQGYLTQVQGTITGLDRAITASGEAGLPSSRLSGLVQTTAAVVPGDSGGPLYDAQGEVLGINAAAASSNATAARTGAPTQSYAVPVTTAMAVVDQIRSGKEGNGVVIGPKALLGVSLADGTGAGALVAQVVADGPAAGAGLQPGARILSVAGQQVGSAAAARAAIASHEPGDRVNITWQSEPTGSAAGQPHSATVVLGTSPVN